MVNPKKIEEVEKLVELIEEYPVVGILDLTKIPSKPLQLMRKILRGKAMIKVSKKSLIKLAIQKSKKKNLTKLIDYLQGQPALILSLIDPFKLFKILQSEKTPAPAREGDIAPKDIVVKAGPTPLPSGPVISLFQKLKIPIMVQDGKIHVREDTVVVKKGEAISADAASLFSKLGIEPMEITLNLVAAYEDGVVYTKDVLAVDEEAYKQSLIEAYLNAFKLSIGVVWPTKHNIEILIRKAYQEAKNLGLNANVLDKGIVKDLILKAYLNAQALKSSVGI